MLASATILQNLLNSDRYLIVAIDCDFNLILNNAKAQQEQQILLGQPLPLGNNLRQSLGNFTNGSEMLALGQKALTGDSFDYTVEYSTPTQEHRYYEINFMPLWEDKNIVGAAAIAQEVTARIQAEQKLYISQKLLETTQQMAELGYWQFDLKTQNIYWSPQTYEIWGYDPQQNPPSYEGLIARIHPEDREKFVQTVDAAIATQSEYNLDLRIIRPDNQLRHLNSRGKAITNNQGETVRLVGSIMDISDRALRENQLTQTVNHTAVQLEQEIQEKGFAQNILADHNLILHDIARDRPLADILSTIALTLEAYIRDSICAIMLLNERKNTLVCGAAPNLSADLKAQIPEGLPIGPKSGSCGTAAYRQKAVIVSDIQTDPLWEDYRDLARAHQIAACWSVPLFDSQSRLIGTLGIYYPMPRRPQLSEWQLLDRFVSLTSIAIENRQNQRSLQEREARFHQALMNAPFPILIHAEDGEILLINKIVSTLTGYDLAEIPTIDDWTAKVYGDRQDIARAQIQSLYTQTQPVEEGETQRIEEGEFQLQSRDNRTLTWYFNSAPLEVLPDGRRTVISMANDITERKQLEVTLRQREARLQKLFQSEMICIGEWDISGKIVDANDALLRLLGYSRAELEAGIIDWRKITPPQYVESDRLSLEQIARFGVNQPYEKEFRDRQGNQTPVLIGACSLDGPQRGFFFVLDISARKDLERSLKKSVRRLENLRSLDLAILSLQSIDTIATEACQRLEDVFDVAKVNLAILSLDDQKARWLGTPDSEFYDPHHYNSLRSLMSQVAQNSPSYLRGDREQYPDVLPPYPDCQTFFCIPICATQTCFGLLFLWYDPVESIPPEKIEIAQEVANQIAIACQQEELNEELRRYTKELEQRVEERTAQLQEINGELEAFTYSVSHDLRAPLRAIQGFSTALYEDYEDEVDDLGRRYLQRLNEAAQKLDRLIQDLLNYSRLSRTEIEFQNVNLEQLVRNTLESLNVTIQERNAQITIEGSLGWVYSNSTILPQILINLIQNALKFTAPEIQPQIRLWSELVDENTRRLWIEDNGIGIKPEHQKRIFTLFERLHGSESYTGTGIGLALVNKGMERLRGRVGVESEIGVGSRFWLNFPLGQINSTQESC
ncbi:MAG: PAS domain S-box protein [Spirulinaceae cyanobacterium]